MRDANGMSTIYQVLVSALMVLIAFASTDVVAMDVTDDEYVIFYHNDALGSPVQVSDHQGRVLWFENSTPYGDGLGRVSSSGLGSGDNLVEEATSRPGYTGHTQDTSTGLVYMKARHYDPVIGRFYSNDPVGFTASNPMMFNRYAYVNNNPYKYIDPDGRELKLSEKAENSEIGVAYDYLKTDPITGPMIDALDDSDHKYTIETHEETLTRTLFQRFISAISGVDPETALHAEYLANQRIITITPGVQAEVYDFRLREDFTIPHSGVLAHEIGHAYIHETKNLGRGRGGQSETSIHDLVDNRRHNIDRSTAGVFISGESLP